MFECSDKYYISITVSPQCMAIQENIIRLLLSVLLPVPDKLVASLFPAKILVHSIISWYSVCPEPTILSVFLPSQAGTMKYSALQAAYLLTSELKPAACYIHTWHGVN